MAKQRLHTRLLSFPGGQDPSGGRVVAVRVEEKGRRNEVVLDYDALQVKGTPRMFEKDGRPWEEVEGVYYPRRLRFVGAEIVEGKELVGYFESLLPGDRGRIINDASGWRSMEGKTFYYFGLRQGRLLVVMARRCVAEEREGTSETVHLSRNQCPSPAFGARLVPNRKRLYERYGGDAVTVRVNGREQRQRLFIGGMEMQGAARPEVGAVLNLSEHASRWATDVRHEADRWATKGEGSKGMMASEIAEEARWVIERLEAGQRVLVHCTAGMNRSATVCCAVVMLLEGVSAEEALARVRESHPWARPDGYHWLGLRWIEAVT